MDEVRLENWCVITRKSSPYTPPEKGVCCLAGEAYGHPKYDNGDEIVTSVIMHADGRTVYTLNRKYILGKAHPGYVTWYRKTHDHELNEDSPFPDR